MSHAQPSEDGMVAEGSRWSIESSKDSNVPKPRAKRKIIDGWALKLIKQGTRKTLRKLVIYKNNFETQNQWVTETPDGIRDEALNELLIAYNTNLKQEKRFEIKSKARKNGKDSITIKARDFTDKEANIFHF
ncbi:2361_t:CDS:2 [Diversispora eburnea]|uniref:2361_t:CDS:1 n=1 Tax=Diversispora eburnea TaxID=1213867 RepID=A0A9N8YN70_9GLOM|nr:2361_t:CDS:2 [Diversispora eburnea]